MKFKITMDKIADKIKCYLLGIQQRKYTTHHAWLLLFAYAISSYLGGFDAEVFVAAF